MTKQYKYGIIKYLLKGVNILFSSNQVFKVSGNNTDFKALTGVIRLLMEDFKVIFKSYMICKGGLLFSVRKEVDYTEIDPDDSRSVDYIVRLIDLYLHSNVYRKSKEEKCKDIFGDGSVEDGWEISVCSETFNSVVKVVPFKCFYHK